MAKRTLLIDGDIFIYQVAAASERSHDWGDGTWTRSANQNEAQATLGASLEKLRSDLDADRMVVALSDHSSPNWRKVRVASTYKHNRASKGVVGPILVRPLRAWVRENYETFQRESLEADDILGILATGDVLAGAGERIIVSEDKDMLTIPGLLWRPHRPDESVRSVSAAEADYNHFYQTLTGDSTDGYPGCPGVGPKTAEKLLTASPTWDAVVEAFESKGLTEKDALTQARLARICRVEDYDFKNKEVILWTPKNVLPKQEDSSMNEASSGTPKEESVPLSA